MEVLLLTLLVLAAMASPGSRWWLSLGSFEARS